MKDDALKPLLENELLDDASKQAISEAWEINLKEAREEIETQLREEYTSRYEHDKGVLVEAVERMVTDGMSVEIAEFVADSKRLTEQQVKLAEEIRKARIDAKEKLAEQMQMLETFVLETLGTEIGAFEADRREIKEGKRAVAKKLRECRVEYNEKLAESVAKMGDFVVNQLSTEMGDFHQDKVALRNQRVRMIAEGKKAIAETRKQIIARSSKLIESRIPKMLEAEMTQFKDDIIASRQKKFGSEMFEAFVAEYKTTFFNESVEVKKLSDQIVESDEKLKKASALFESATKMVKDSQKKQVLAESKATRIVVTNELLSKLSGSQKDVMAELLEGVKTENLRAQFRKYIPAVTSGAGATALSRKTSTVKPLQEGKKEITGNKENNKLTESVDSEDASDVAELIEMKRLAGMN